MSIQVAQILSELLAFEVNSRSDLNAWYKKSEEVYKAVKRDNLELPGIVWHYLSDADIRLKEPEYGEHQVEGIKDYLESLSNELKDHSRDA